MLKLENTCCKNMQNGEFVYVTGDIGPGKTTLFSIISRIINPTAGRVLIDGRDIVEMSLCERTGLIANVLQDKRQGNIAEMTISENMNIAYRRGSRRYCMVVTRKLRNYFKEKLSILNMGLENRLNEYASNLPGGQRQTLSLIMATLTDYEVLLLDEITASLDQNTSSLVVNITQNIAKQEDKVCLAITHDQLNKESKL